MKKVLSMMAIALMLISCGSDDDNVEESNASIVGTFLLTSSNSPFNDDYNGDGVTSTNLLDEVPCLANTITFNADSTYSNTQTELAIEIDGSGNTSAGCDGPFTTTGTYSLNGTVLTLNEETTTDPNGSGADIEFNDATTIVTQAGLTITVDTGFGNAVFVFDRQ